MVSFVHSFFFLLIVLCMVMVGMNVGATAPAPVIVSLPIHYVVQTDVPLPTVAESYIVVDAVQGTVLLEHLADQARPIASITKLIVAAAIMESDLISGTTTITANDVAMPEDFGKLSVGEVYSVRELLFPYLLESSNDAGAALARVTTPRLGQAVDELLSKADVGGEVTVADTTGLSRDNTATAQALAKLFSYVAERQPYLYDITELSVYRGPYVGLVNNNPSADLSAYRGGKHGYTYEAGHTLVAHIATPFADGTRELVYVVLGSDDSQEALLALMNHVESSVSRVPTTLPESGILETSVDR